MDLRTKLVFALVAVSLGSMLVFGLAIEPQVESRLRERTLAALDELAEAKRESLGWIIEGWRDRVDLIASRTQLRATVARHGSDDPADVTATVSRILLDALQASETVTFLEVRDAGGEVVGRVEREAAPVPADPPPGGPAPAPDLTSPRPGVETSYAGVAFVASGPPRVRFVSPLEQDGRSVGSLLVEFEARELAALTGHSHDLGETGEMLIVAEDETGVVHTLHPARHDGGGAGGLTLPPGEETLWARALAGETGTRWEDETDYRGQAVWAATRHVAETGWGVVVKVDESEQIRPYEEFDAWLRKTAVIFAAFAILAGAALGMFFATPVHSLAEVVDRVRKGDMRARAAVSRHDEVGVLARAFNEMADELEARMALLVEFRTFFDVSIDLMCIAGTDGYFKRVNPAFERTLGWSSEQLLERPFFDLVHPDDVEPTRREVAKLVQGIPTISFSNRFRCADGSWKRLRWTSFPEEGTGKLYAIAHVVSQEGAP